MMPVGSRLVFAVAAAFDFSLSKIETEVVFRRFYNPDLIFIVETD
jgi:hypothetical protein